MSDSVRKLVSALIKNASHSALARICCHSIMLIRKQISGLNKSVLVSKHKGLLL